MSSLKAQLASLTAVLLWIAAVPMAAATTSASSVSDSIAASVGSISNSIQGSSNSSRNDQVADGEYRVIEVAEVAERPGTVRATLQPVAAAEGTDGSFFLFLPQPVADQARIAPGAVVSARQRPYGLEFAKGMPRQAFFLVLADEWYRELQAHVVKL